MFFIHYQVLKLLVTYQQLIDELLTTVNQLEFLTNLHQHGRVYQILDYQFALYLRIYQS